MSEAAIAFTSSVFRSLLTLLRLAKIVSTEPRLNLKAKYLLAQQFMTAFKEMNFISFLVKCQKNRSAPPVG